ncbi:MAG: DUF177 domain-containing protein [Gammaproteobacteria bacterium]|nr:DUF177 domain-containing protein [Gammaproteobacteria bacterium]
MRDPLPESIDPRYQLRVAGKVTGIWPAASCQRVLAVAEQVLSDVVVEFSLSDTGQTIKLDGHISVELQLCCQRCLQSMSWQIDEPMKILLVQADAKASMVDDYDVLELDEHGRIDTAQWIEDEIILRIPNVPVHSRTQDCDPDMLKRAREFDRNAAEAANQLQDNPFKVLQGWKGNERK